MRKKQRIGIFGGTFDPPHLGHIAIACFLKEAHHLDHIFFIPAGQNPHKKGKQSTPAKVRLELCRKALQGVPACSVLDVGMKDDGPTYMIDTLLLLRQRPKLKNATFYLLLGEDLLNDFCLWKDYEAILDEVTLIVAKRLSSSQEKWKTIQRIKEAVIEGLTETPRFDISATVIRERMVKGLYCGHLLPERVVRYIEKHKLYRK